MAEEGFKEEYANGYKDGFAAGYKTALSEIVEKKKEKIDKMKKDLDSSDFDPRWWFWPW